MKLLLTKNKRLNSCKKQKFKYNVIHIHYKEIILWNDLQKAGIHTHRKIRHPNSQNSILE